MNYYFLFRLIERFGWILVGIMFAEPIKKILAL